MSIDFSVGDNNLSTPHFDEVSRIISNNHHNKYNNYYYLLIIT